MTESDGLGNLVFSRWHCIRSTVIIDWTWQAGIWQWCWTGWNGITRNTKMELQISSCSCQRSKNFHLFYEVLIDKIFNVIHIMNIGVPLSDVGNNYWKAYAQTIYHRCMFIPKAIFLGSTFFNSFVQSVLFTFKCFSPWIGYCIKIVWRFCLICITLFLEFNQCLNWFWFDLSLKTQVGSLVSLKTNYIFEHFMEL